MHMLVMQYSLNYQQKYVKILILKAWVSTSVVESIHILQPYITSWSISLIHHKKSEEIETKTLPRIQVYINNLNKMVIFEQTQKCPKSIKEQNALQKVEISLEINLYFQKVCRPIVAMVGWMPAMMKLQ